MKTKIEDESKQLRKNLNELNGAISEETYCINKLDLASWFTST